jgi:hypothetical protein
MVSTKRGGNLLVHIGNGIAWANLPTVPPFETAIS